MTCARGSEIHHVVSASAAAQQADQSALVFSAAGPDDASVAGFDGIARDVGLTRARAASSVGTVLAEVKWQLLDRVDLQRVVVAGDDSSGEVASALDI